MASGSGRGSGTYAYKVGLPVPNEPVDAGGAVGSTGPIPDILERPRDKTRTAEVSASALQFLFAEMVAYTQLRVSGIADFERLLSQMGAQVGQRALVLAAHRKETSANPKRPRRETRLLPTLLWVHTGMWKAVFGMQADGLERSTESERSDECTCSDLPDMISTNDPFFSRGISIPKEMTQLSLEAFTAGVVEGALDGLGFVRGLDSPACARDRTQRAYGRVPQPDNDLDQVGQSRDGARSGYGRPVGYSYSSCW